MRVAIQLIAAAALAVAAPTELSARAASCGIKGYDKGTSAYFYQASSSVATYAACSAKCTADTKCQSFAIGSGACLLYSTTVAANVATQSSSPYSFYDRACIAATSTTVAPSVSSSATRSSTVSSQRSSSASSSSAVPSATCGVIGYDEDTKAYFYSKATSVASQSLCGAHCLTDSQCLSYAFGSKTCYHYTVAVAGNFKTNSGSPYAFYDRSCVAVTSSSSSSQVASSTRSSSQSSVQSSSLSSSSQSSTQGSTGATNILSSSSATQSSSASQSSSSLSLPTSTVSAQSSSTLSSTSFSTDASTSLSSSSSVPSTTLTSSSPIASSSTSSSISSAPASSSILSSSTDLSSSSLSSSSSSSVPTPSSSVDTASSSSSMLAQSTTSSLFSTSTSTVDQSSTSSLSSSSSTFEPSSTSSPSPTPTPTNYLTNGGFESGLSPWTIATDNAVYDLSFTVPRTGSHSVRGRAGTIANRRDIIAFMQTGIAIPDGTQVQVYGYARVVLQNPALLNFVLYFDGVVAGTLTASSNGVYFKIGGTAPITVSGSSHTIQLIATSIDPRSGIELFDVDDFAIMSV